MIEIYLFIVLCVGGSMVFGWLSPFFVSMIDSMLDYGHILSFIRLNAFKRALKRAGANPDVIVDIKKQMADLEFGERIEHMNDVYWTFAKNDMRFLSIICIKCMTIRWSIIIFNLMQWCLIAANWQIVCENLIGFIVLYLFSNFVMSSVLYYNLKN